MPGIQLTVNTVTHREEMHRPLQSELDRWGKGVSSDADGSSVRNAS